MLKKEDSAMDFNQEEESIRKLIGSCKMKEPPSALFKNYEQEVLEKIRGSHSGPVFGWQVSAGLALLFVLAIAFLFLVKPRLVTHQVEPSVVRAPTAPVPVPAAAKIPVPDHSQADFDQMSHDVFILETLGEDEGILDEFDRMESDTELFVQPQTVL